METLERHCVKQLKPFSRKNGLQLACLDLRMYTVELLHDDEDEPTSKRHKPVWEMQHKKMWEALGKERPEAKYAELHPMPMMSKRAADCIISNSILQGSELCRHLSGSSQESLERQSSSSGHRQLKRLLKPSEHLKLLGWYGPGVDVRGIGPNALKNLAGEGMSVPSVTLVSLSGLLALEHLCGSDLVSSFASFMSPSQDAAWKAGSHEVSVGRGLPQLMSGTGKGLAMQLVVGNS